MPQDDFHRLFPACAGVIPSKPTTGILLNPFPRPRGGDPDDSTYPFISYLSDLLAKSKPSDEAVKKLHDCIDKVAVALGQDSTDVFRVLLAKLIEQPEEKQTFDRLVEIAEKSVTKAKY